MYSGIRDWSPTENRANGSLPSMEQAAAGKEAAFSHALAGEDLAALWDVSKFVLDPRMYSRAFMKRMHHPFDEVLACLFLSAEYGAVAYHSYFKGNKPSALSHLPTVAKAASEHKAARVVLAYNMIFDPSASLPDVRRMHARMAETGVELYDFLLINPGQAPRSLLAHTPV